MEGASAMQSVHEIADASPQPSPKLVVIGFENDRLQGVVQALANHILGPSHWNVAILRFCLCRQRATAPNHGGPDDGAHTVYAPFVEVVL